MLFERDPRAYASVREAPYSAIRERECGKRLQQTFIAPGAIYEGLNIVGPFRNRNATNTKLGSPAPVTNSNPLGSKGLAR